MADTTYGAYLVASSIAQSLLTQDTLEQYAPNPGKTYRKFAENDFKRLAEYFGFGLVPLARSGGAPTAPNLEAAE